ncbi:hypothetical protein F4604DRAFT_1933663 [Suillus subluteus]|nr:hypothetical protein F4604DRAFT_1933663 [Suillus subluteus]
MVSTRPSNITKRPAQVKADNAHIEQANQEKEEKTQKGIERVAAAQEKLSLQQTTTLAPKKPRPHAIPHGGKATPANTPSEAGPAAADQSSQTPAGSDGGAGSQAQGDAGGKLQVDEDDEDPGAMQGKRKRVQKTVHRDAVNAARAILASKSPSDADGKFDAKSSPRASDDIISKGRTPVDLKQAYKGGVKTWAQRVHMVNIEKNAHSAKMPQSLATSSLDQSTNTTLSQLTRVTTAASTATPSPGTPTNSVFGDDTESVGCFPDEDGHLESMAAYTLVGMRKPSSLHNVDIIEVRSSSLTPPPPPPSQYNCDTLVKMEHIDITVGLSKNSDQDLMYLDDEKDEGEVDNGNEVLVVEEQANPAQASKWTTLTTNMEVVDNDSDEAPPTKHIKTETRSKPGKGTGEVTKAKYKNGDLPAGCLDNNVWRGIFIPTVAHATGGDNIDPWLIEDDALIPILKEAWTVIYNGKSSLMNHAIVPGSAVYQVTKQHLSEWCGGFGSAAVMMFTTFMAADPLYDNEDSRADFADFWLEDNRWLFTNIESDDKKLWTGMWQSMFVLQTFAAHLNYTQGRVSIPSLMSEEQSCRTALALSGAAVKCALHLLSTKQMSFEVKSTITKGKKKATRKGKGSAANGEQWTAVISENETFLEPLWGYDSSMFLQAINRIPTSNMKAIIEQAQQYMKATTTHSGQSKMDAEEAQDEDIDEEYADIFAFY